jgi:hypothetical protein
MKQLIVILILCVIIYFLLNYFKNSNSTDGRQDDNNNSSSSGSGSGYSSGSNESYSEFFDNDNNNNDILDNVIGEKNINKENNSNKQQKNITPHIQQDYAGFTHKNENFNNGLEHFDSADLLPKLDGENTINDDGWTIKNNKGWDESNPQIKLVEGNAWLNERKFLGISTVGSSLRNATHDIRRDIPNPQMVVSPWNNTTMVPDTNNKGLCTL